MARRWRSAWKVALAVTAITADAGAADKDAFRVRIGTSLHAFAVRRGLEGAHERLGRPECQKLFTDFRDESGRPLQQKLDGLGLTGQQFLGFVGFYEGYGHLRCSRERVMAFTQPGSLAVYVCPQIARQPRETVEMILVHEMLHSLGLGENPPTTYQITDQVTRRCGGRESPLNLRTATR